MTFINCKKVIENNKSTGTITVDFITDMTNKLDVFLLNNRITQEQYQELINLMKTN